MYFFVLFHSQRCILGNMSPGRTSCWHLCHRHLLHLDMTRPRSIVHPVQTRVAAARAPPQHVGSPLLPDGLQGPMLDFANPWVSLCTMSGRGRDVPGPSSARGSHAALTKMNSKRPSRCGGEITHPLPPRSSLRGPPLPEPGPRRGCINCTSLADRERALVQPLGLWVSASVHCQILSGTYFPMALLFVLSVCIHSLYAPSTACGWRLSF